MKQLLSNITIWLAVAFFVASTLKSEAFALLGPVQPWMQSSNGVIYPSDIGGPMEITNEYRWNVPVVSYGFDQAFLDYFGSNGVAAVEGAIQILNDLPPASQMVPGNYPLNSKQVNYAAQAQSLIDLKSETLQFLLEQLGLAQPTRNISVLKQWTPDFIATPYQIDWFYWAVPDYIVQRNFDPQTLLPTVYINQTLYSTHVVSGLPGDRNAIQPFAIVTWAEAYTAVADFYSFKGEFYTGLTYDDVGGLAYLLSTNNVNYETVLPGVTSVGVNPGAFVNGAWRPGVDKVTFVPQPTGQLSGTFLQMTNQFTDAYVTNGTVMHQQLQRIITQPDFLFSAGFDTFRIGTTNRTGTTNWINNALQNNSSSGAGPGVIQPPVIISFQKAGTGFYSLPTGYSVVWSEDEVSDNSSYYGTFNDSTNTPIIYPIQQTGNVSMAVWVLLRHSNYQPNNFQSFKWSPNSQAGTIYTLQTSTNLSTWNTLFAVTNNGSVYTYQNVNANSSARFYRLIPQ